MGVRRAGTVLLIAAVAVGAYPAWLALKVWRQSHRDELHSAGAIVVLGAAQYDGTPSPVLRARLDHARYLFEEGLSGLVIVTGGKQPGDRFTEAEAAQRYLVESGVPESSIIREDSGTTTLESMRAVGKIARGRGVDSVLLVSDPLHSERIARIASDLGFDEVYSSPASYLRLERSRVTKVRELVREVGSLMIYEFLGR